MKTQTITQFDPITNQHVSSWINGPYDAETKQMIEKMLRDSPQEIVDAFYSNLSFGTGGMRGIMGVGTNRVNKYTLQSCTQGLANYLNQQATKEKSVFIGYDSRHHSKEFAEECAKVLAGNDIHVFIFKNIRPTPLVSFGCRYKKCDAAIMLTASHNPPEYNGYKVYWNDGSQVIFPHDKGIVDEVNKIHDICMVKSVESVNHPLITWVEEEIDQAYLKAIQALQIYSDANKTKGSLLKVVYTSLHGTGITLIPHAMQQWGFSNLELVKDQVIPDGSFPTCQSPNPEDPMALELGVATLLKVQGDLLIATDPDADRVGVAVNHHGKIYYINGNQLACLLLHHILKGLSLHNRLPQNAAFIKTIVTTELFNEICKSFDKPCFDVLTGFKYVAEKIREWENLANNYQYIFGGEESYGYLYGTLVRDKDAVICSLLVCEMALQARLQNKTLIDQLHELWYTYGTYVEKVMSINFDDSRAGKEQMTKSMTALRQKPPQHIANQSVELLEDYETSICTHFKSGQSTKISLPKSNVLLFRLADGSVLVIRPSGTEPKIKIYCSVVKKGPVNEALMDGEKHADILLNALHQTLGKN